MAKCAAFMVLIWPKNYFQFILRKKKTIFCILSRLLNLEILYSTLPYFRPPPPPFLELQRNLKTDILRWCKMFVFHVYLEDLN